MTSTGRIQGVLHNICKFDLVKFVGNSVHIPAGNPEAFCQYITFVFIDIR